MGDQKAVSSSKNPAGLEMLLRKGRFSFGSDFSVGKRNELIQKAAAAIKQAGEVFHKDVKVEVKPTQGITDYTEVTGPMGVYATISYVPPNLSFKAAIKVSVPFQSIEGLTDSNDTELVRIREVLAPLGYR